VKSARLSEDVGLEPSFPRQQGQRFVSPLLPVIEALPRSLELLLFRRTHSSVVGSLSAALPLFQRRSPPRGILAFFFS